jgi:hypothetical protein
MNTKGLLSSATIWGLIGIAVPYLDTLHAYLMSLPDGSLPPGVAIAIQGLGWILAFYGRTKATKRLSGLV